MLKNDFDNLINGGYANIPVSREILADCDTPLSLYLKLANKPWTYLFESVEGGERWGRYSIIGLPCRKIIRIKNNQLTITENGAETHREHLDDPLQWIETYHHQQKTYHDRNLPIFTGGLVGYFGYETIRYIEPRLARSELADPLNVPDILLMLSNDLVVYDNLQGKAHIIVHADPADTNAWENAQKRLDELAAQCKSPTPYPTPPVATKKQFTSNFTQQSYEALVERAKRYIVDGDIMQVVPSQRLTAPFNADPLHLYRTLRHVNPSPYMFYLNLEDFYIVGASPEILVRVEDNTITVRPIAGTRKRGATPEEDIALEQNLLADQKELAEHLMLIDLGRNDVGKVAEIGSVRVTEKMVVERYSHVMHIVSEVQGKLKNNYSAIDALSATLPAGTLSGAPKIRAMEIIEEFEPVKRGIYGGAVGYWGWNGNMDTAIAIRTAVIKDNQIHVQAGGGIVYDSDPTAEWEETLNKAKVLLTTSQTL